MVFPINREGVLTQVATGERCHISAHKESNHDNILSFHYIMVSLRSQSFCLYQKHDFLKIGTYGSCKRVILYHGDAYKTKITFWRNSVCCAIQMKLCINRKIVWSIEAKSSPSSYLPFPPPNSLSVFEPVLQN